MTCIAKMEHSCGSSDALQLYENEDGSITGYCFACDTYENDPLGGKGKKAIPKSAKLSKTKEEIAEELKTIKSCSTFNLQTRGLKKAYLEPFGVKMGVSTSDGKTPELVYFPYYGENQKKIVGYKARTIKGKNFWSLGETSKVELFGWRNACETGGKKLYITEGEYDAVALKEIFRRHTKDGYEPPAVVSLPHGASSAHKDLSRLRKNILARFKEIYFVFDDDEPGNKAVEECMKVFPDAKTVKLPHKDANECLKKGSTKKAFDACMWEAKKPTNSRLVYGYEVHEKAKKPAEWGWTWPWEGMTKRTRGIRKGETIYIAAAPKMGKSEILNAIGEHLISTYGIKILVAKPEEANSKTYKLMCGKVEGKVFHDPEVEFDEDAYERAGEVIKDKLLMLNLYQHIDWETLEGDIIAAKAEGCEAIFIDPITNLTNGMSSSEINSALQGISTDLSALAKDLDVVIFIFCHTNKAPKGSKGYDRGGKITSDAFAGSSAMARSCNYAIALEGNRDPDLNIYERNLRQLCIIEDREYGEVGGIEISWDRKTQLFSEVG